MVWFSLMDVRAQLLYSDVGFWNFVWVQIAFWWRLTALDREAPHTPETLWSRDNDHLYVTYADLKQWFMQGQVSIATSFPKLLLLS